MLPPFNACHALLHPVQTWYVVLMVVEYEVLLLSLSPELSSVHDQFFLAASAFCCDVIYEYVAIHGINYTRVQTQYRTS